MGRGNRRRADDGQRQSVLFPVSPTGGGGPESHGSKKEAGPGEAEQASPRRECSPFATVMPIDGLNLPTEAISLLRKLCSGLNEMQADSVKKGILEGKSVLVSAPTAGGKTIVAWMAILACLSRGAGRAVYLCPMKSLAQEKYAELEGLRALRINGGAARVAMATGEHVEGDLPPEKADMLVATNERMDSMIRKGRGSPGRTGLIVVDEIHMAGDRRRGPVLETVIAHAKSMKSPPQIVALSATAPNAGELASWLGAELVQSDKRPVPLHEGVYDGETLRMGDGRALPVERGGDYGNAVHVGLASALAGHKTLVFADSRRGAASMAREAAGAIGQRLSREDRKALRELSARISGPGEPTRTARALASMVRDGAAFHHAGLGQVCREAVEEGFREGALRLVVSTPTLAVGVNLPARRVVVSSLTMFDQDAKRRVPISVRAYRQMAGRAGRPQYDDAGEAVIVTDGQGADRAWRHYIGGEPERVESRMADASSLLAHLLSLVVIRPGITEGRIAGFFLMTLAAVQAGEDGIRRAVDGGLRFLLSNGLVSSQRNGGHASFMPTRLGTLATRRYMEPRVALAFQRAARAGTSGASHTLGLIYAAVAFGTDGAYARKDDLGHIEELVAGHSDEIFVAIRDTGNDVERSALALWRWIDETPDTQIADRLDIEPGIMDTIAGKVARLVCGIAAVSRLERNRALADEAEKLAVRIEHGVRPELVDLVGLRHVSRSRARKLHDTGYETRKSLRALSAQKLAQIIPVGEKRAAEILRQASGG
ncbi:MAG: DEAD/DEAH box helicase [Thaumarchaeota archaeon]|nr:DEAD/DEAH box helicase [Nitrososphaerota archaeon]